jgi:hypothetical protein
MKTPTMRLAQLAVLLPVVCVLAAGCEKVIDVDLTDAAPRLVIEAEISQNKECTAHLSRTTGFNQPNVFAPVTNALVVLHDNAGSADTLRHIMDGDYQGSGLVISGTPGTTYTLTVKDGGQTFEAESSMPQFVRIDSLSVVTLTLGGEVGRVIAAHFVDPPGTKNYYRIRRWKNQKLQPFVFLFDDRFQDGTPMTASLIATPDTISSGDQISVELQCIDRGVYDYFVGVRMISGLGGPPQSASPTNPPSNFSNGALGYFSAHADAAMAMKVTVLHTGGALPEEHHLPLEARSR